VVAGGFYGWPYAYLGPHVDNRVVPLPDLVAKTITPDLSWVLMSPRCSLLYEKQQFPSAHWHGAFIGEPGSGISTSETDIRSSSFCSAMASRRENPKPFFPGFLPDPAGSQVYGRTVGVAVAADGSLLISDDGQKLIWCVSYESQPSRAQ